MLLISRLIPSFQLVEETSESTEESKASEINAKGKYEIIDEYVKLIKEYSGNSTYFVRKIAA